MKNKIILSSLPLLLLALTISNFTYASEITGNLSSAGVNSSVANSGAISGIVIATPGSGNITGNVTGGNSSGGVANGGGSGGGGGGFVFPNLEQPNLNINGTGQLLSANINNDVNNLTNKVYVASTAYRPPSNNIPFTDNRNRQLAFGIAYGDLDIATTTEVLAQVNNPVVTTNPIVTESGMFGLSYGAWVLLLALFLLAILGYYYLREKV